jgi:phosphatidylglycerophosphatase A
MRELFLTFFYLGNLPKAPGTFGSIGGLLSGLGILNIMPPSTLFSLAVALSVVAVVEIDKYEKITKTHDSSKIVIDEVAGMWFAMSLVPNDIWIMILVFVLFRAYDIFKPSFIGRVDRDVKGGLGVMLDDVLAGFMAGFTALLILNILK